MRRFQGTRALAFGMRRALGVLLACAAFWALPSAAQASGVRAQATLLRAGAATAAVASSPRLARLLAERAPVRIAESATERDVGCASERAVLPLLGVACSATHARGHDRSSSSLARFDARAFPAKPAERRYLVHCALLR